ncbi:ribosomal protein S12 methylthiotransferase RimO [Ruminococcus sp. CAG:579]|nr:ribosomal protein S12 methylthiotransferase RimO [Ruminococcus sp. CAG:579]
MAIRVGMVSLGCPKNQVDAEKMMFSLRKYGFELIQDAALADVAIINTCGFIQSAKEEAIETMLEFIALKKEGRIKGVICTGCLAERYKQDILDEMPELDAVVSLGKDAEIAQIVKDIMSGENGEKLYAGDKCSLPLEGGRIISTQPFYAYLKIAEGCSNGCTYCAIPAIRGKFRSRTIENILEEARWLADNGVTELVVVAQDTTRYGEDIYGESRLPELLTELCKIEGFHWIRTLYLYPERITDKLIDTIAEQDKLIKYFDIPIQHCNADILKRMNRCGSRETLTELIGKIRARIPNVIIRTTLITGFPGETQEQFEELAEFANDMRFERLGCFAYSAEEGTPAAKFEGQLTDEEKERRSDVIMEQQMFINDVQNQEMIGKVVEVVTEGFDRYAECCFGRSAADAPEIDGKIFFSSERKLTVGEYVKVKIDDTLDCDLLGTVCE